MRWMRLHCPPDTGFEIRALEVWGRARHLSVAEAPHNTEFYTWMGEKQSCFFKPPRPGTEPQTLAWKTVVPTTTLGPPHVVGLQGESSYWNTERSWMFPCCPMMRKRANKASHTIEKVTRFVCLYQLYIQLHHLMSDDLDIFCLIVTCN